MTQARVLVVAHDMALRQSLEFALAAEGYAVSLCSDADNAQWQPGYACLVLDETGLAGTKEALTAFCARFPSVVVLVDRPRGWLAGLADLVVAKPVNGDAVTVAVRTLVAENSLST